MSDHLPFWAEGPRCLAEARDDAEDEARPTTAELERRLAAARDPEERERLEAKLRALQAGYRPTAEEIRRSLF